jgi:trimeric autotransporter adhesin
MYNNLTGSGNIAIGKSAGYNETGSNKLYIENSNSATPLIYGEFDTNLARINGKLEVTGTVKIAGGTPGLGKILTSDANGLASWETAAAGATKIDELTDGKTLGNSIFLGSGSGGNFTAANGYNIGMGVYALSDNVNGYYNVAIGVGALEKATGHYNTALGSAAGATLVEGDYNIFLGTQAGRNASGSNKLYIEPTDSATPLIYGEFDNDLARINGKLEVTGTVKIEGGTPGAGKVLTSDAAGLASWETAATTNSTLNTFNTATYAVLTTDNYVIYIESSQAPEAVVTVTLPTAVGVKGKEYTIKNTAAINVTIATTNSQQIWQDAAHKTTTAILGVESQNNWIKVISDGLNWISFRALY